MRDTAAGCRRRAGLRPYSMLEKVIISGAYAADVRVMEQGVGWVEAGV